MLYSALPAAAQDYPLLNLFWTMMWVFLWTLWLFLVIRVALDIFRSSDMNGWAKAGWLAVVLFLPYIGVLIYLIARGDKMQAREIMDLDATDDFVRNAPKPSAAAPTTSKADELSKLAKLHDLGVLTDEEFASQKATVLS